MTLAYQKIIERPDHISMLMPTRGRPQIMEKMLFSMQETVIRKDLFDVWIYVDDDDPIMRQYIAEEFPKRNFGFKIYWHIAPRSLTQGEMTIELIKACNSNGGFYAACSDDYIYVTKGWDEMLRQARNQFPDHMILGYPICANSAPDQVTFSFVSTEFMNALGYYYTEYFPFWFDDSWLDEVANMAQRKVRIEVRIEPTVSHKTYRMRNLIFWHTYFVNLLDERFEGSVRILKAIYGDTPAFQTHLQEAKKIYKSIRRAEKKRKRIQQFHYENRFAPRNHHEKHVLQIHETLQKQALKRLQRMCWEALCQGRADKFLRIIENMCYGTCLKTPLSLGIRVKYRIDKLIERVDAHFNPRKYENPAHLS